MNTRLIIIDYMPLARKVLSEELPRNSSIDVVATAPHPQLAARKVARSAPDVILLDLEPPVEKHIAALKGILEHCPLPVVLLTSLPHAERRHVADELDLAPGNILTKPGTAVARGLETMAADIQQAVVHAHRNDLLQWRRTAKPRVDVQPVEGHRAVIAIGASTGGTEALCHVLSALPAESPPVLIVQHMPGDFTGAFAHRLDELSAMEVREAAEGDEVRTGLALLGHGDYHLSLTRTGGRYRAALSGGPKVSGHRPSVDVLFNSVARAAGADAVGVVLTGMGRDGADGLKAMRDAGAATFAQDEATSVVFGMPKEAHLNGGAQQLVPLDDVASTIIGAVNRLRRRL